MLIGTALLSTIDALIKHNLFNNNETPIRNINLILSLYLIFASDWKDMCKYNELGWTIEVIRRAEKYNIPLTGLPETVNKVKDFKKDPNMAAHFDNNEDKSPSAIAGRMTNVVQAYMIKPLVGVITAESLKN